MFNLNEDIFGLRKENFKIHENFIFVSDLYAKDYVGGAELTLQALIDTAPGQCRLLRSSEVKQQHIEQNIDKFWIFGNFSSIDPNLIPLCIAKCSYAVIECDYKFCKHRSPEKHEQIEKQKCDCHTTQLGQLISTFLASARHVFWMSIAQQKIYQSKFSILSEKNNDDQTVLSSVFSAETLQNIKNLRGKQKNDVWLIQGSNSWIKGTEQSQRYCEKENLKYETIGNVPYDTMLEKLASSLGLVFLPLGGDTCPRIVCEAKLLGCKVICNEYVQHSSEKWFTTDNLNEIEEYLSKSPAKFWSCVADAMVKRPKISGYVTTFDCVRQTYPFEKCIRSLLRFCSEVCVVDGGSQDGTWEKLQSLANQDPTIKLKQIIRNWDSPRFAVFDGMQKAAAREMCTGDFCWQADSDEIFHQDDVKKVFQLCYATHTDIIALPVIEYWGSAAKVRLDVTPWKWRLTRNKPHITHGIPRQLKRTDESGNLYSLPGSDGCDLIHKETGETLNFVSFYTKEADELRIRALRGDIQAKNSYETWINEIVKSLPAAYHYSWFDIERKIKLYRDYWQRHWNNLSNSSEADIAENNMFFDVSWSAVSDDMIKQRAEELKNKTGGHIFHTKWLGSSTPSIRCFKSEPI